MPGKPDPRRYINIYCSSREQKNYFKELAEKEGVSLSEYCLSMMERSVSEQAKNPPRAKVSENMKVLEEELARLRGEAKTNDLLLKRYEADNRRLREAAKFTEDFEGERQLDTALIAVLRRGMIHDYKLLEVLGIGPEDHEQTSSVQKQLEILERHGMIRKDARGWRWLKK